MDAPLVEGLATDLQKILFQSWAMCLAHSCTHLKMALESINALCHSPYASHLMLLEPVPEARRHFSAQIHSPKHQT